MRTSFEVAADSRSTQGKGASRRLRRERARSRPSSMDGSGEAGTSPSNSRTLLTLRRQSEKFYSTIISLKIDGKPQPVLLRDVQIHPAKHAWCCTSTCSAWSEDQPLRLQLPIHFLNEASAPGVKLQGGTVSHLRTDIEIAVPAEGSAGSASSSTSAP